MLEWLKIIAKVFILLAHYNRGAVALLHLLLDYGEFALIELACLTVSKGHPLLSGKEAYLRLCFGFRLRSVLQGGRPNLIYKHTKIFDVG